MRFSLFCFIFSVGLLIPFIKSDKGSFKRKIESSLNPGCEKFDCKKNNVSILYVKASSSDDVLHYLYSAGSYTETPSVIIIRSPNSDSNLTIDYQNLFNGSKQSVIHLSDTKYSAFGFVLTRLYEYNDIKNTAKMDGDFLARGFDEFQWQYTLNSSSSATFSTNTTSNTSDTIFSHGNISLNFNFSGIMEHAPGFPHLQFTGNNTQMDFILNKLNPNSSKSQFVVEFALINKLNNSDMKVDRILSLDDEKSPGVFKVINFLGQKSNENFECSTYMQWKPVSYLSASDKSLNYLGAATEHGIYPFNQSIDSDRIIRSSLVYSFFGDSLFSGHNTMRLTNVSFGSAGDKFYAGTNYSIWTASFGQGVPPPESLSIAVILVIAFGLGVPFLLVVAGSLYLVIKKRLNNKVVYQTIEDPIN